MKRYLTVDLGTTYFKFAVFDAEGRICGLARRPAPVESPCEGRAEMRPEAFVETLVEGFRSLAVQSGGLDAAEAISFATQTNTFLLLDGENRPVTPIILWSDSRASGLESEIERRTARIPLARITGVPALGHTFMLPKLAWLREHEPHAWGKSRRLCLLSDYLTLLLTGHHVTEAGAAGLTGLVDLEQATWFDSMLQAWELDRDWMPRIARAGTDLGSLGRVAGARFGLPASCRFVVGCLDQYSGPIGLGAFGDDCVAETTGTVMATVRLAAEASRQSRGPLFQGCAYRPGVFWQMAFGNVSANYLHWYRGLLSDRPEFEDLLGLAANVEPGAGGLRLNANAALERLEDVFPGITPQHSRGQIVRAIVEAVAAALDQQVTIVAAGQRLAEIRSAGGAARSPFWLQVKADVTGIPVRPSDGAQPTSLGAAILAAAGVSGSEPAEIAQEWVRLGSPCYPDEARRAIYRDLSLNHREPCLPSAPPRGDK